SETSLIDSETGFYLSADVHDKVQRRLQRWVGWRSIVDGPRFPTAVIDMQFTNDELRTFDMNLVDEVRFNVPLSPATFVLGAPAGAIIVDSREPQEGVVQIHRDVFDASSAEQVKAASQPLKQDSTPTELAAFADLRRTYVLPDGEALRRLGPPFPLSRNYLMRMLRPDYAPERRGTLNAIITWQDGQMSGLPTYYGDLVPTLEHLIGSLLNQPSADIELPADILGVALPGDYLVRSDATHDELLAALSELASQELGRPVRLSFQDVSRVAYVARGTLTLDESKLAKYRNKPSIAINAGEGAGAHGEIINVGDFATLLRELSEYIDVGIIDETTSTDRRLAWSKRSYNHDGQPDSQRLLDPRIALDLVTQQTGITFELQTRTRKVLTLSQPPDRAP
ncbi:MAG: hypothetical protein KDA92_25995, partial [Planctomycetales bacterium]|nr:hypothetical protein [Planctomycetales bacterium]